MATKHKWLLNSAKLSYILSLFTSLLLKISFTPQLPTPPAALPFSHSKSLCKKRRPDSNSSASHNVHSSNLPACVPMQGPGMGQN